MVLKKRNRLKESIEKSMKYSLKDITDEGLRVELMDKLLEARKLLDKEA